MAETTKGIPFPAGGDSPAGAAQMEALARAVDARVPGFACAAGTVNVSLSNAASGTAAVTFPAGLFEAGSTVLMFAQKTSVAGAASALVENVQNVSHTGGTVVLAQASGTAVTVSAAVSWFAVQVTNP